MPMVVQDVNPGEMSVRRRRDKLPAAIKCAYGLPGFATTSLSLLISIYVNDFYVSVGASLAFISFFTALARSFDVITDPVMGWLSDSSRKETWAWLLPVRLRGRRKPYMLTGCLAYAVFLLALFVPPKQDNSDADDEGGGNTRAAYWFGVFYTLFYLADTYCNVPYEALGPELTDDYEDRSAVFFTARMFNFLGMLFAAAAPAGLIAWFRSSSDASLACTRLFNESTIATANATGDVAETLMSHLTLPLNDSGVCSPTTHCSGSNLVCLEAEDPGNFFEAELEVLQDSCYEPMLANMSSWINSLPIAGCGSDVRSGSCGEPPCAPFQRYVMDNLTASRQSFMIISFGFGVYYVASVLLCVISIRERSLGGSGAVPLVPSILRAFGNVAFRPLLAAWALDGLALSAIVTMFPFFIRYVVIPDGVLARSRCCPMSAELCMGLSMLGLLVAAMAAAPAWLWLSKWQSKYVAWQIYNVVNVLSNVLFFIPNEGDPAFTIGIMFLNGIPVGGQFLTNAILADVIDYDEFLNGTRSEAAFSVFATLIPKFVAIPASAIPLAIVNILGFKQPIDGVVQPQSSRVKVFIRMSFVLLPLLCATAGSIIKLWFPIKTREQCRQIQEGIKLHKMDPSLRVVDPVTSRMNARKRASAATKGQLCGGASASGNEDEVWLLDLSKEEEDKVWIYENFTATSLKLMLQTGNPDAVVYEMALYTLFSLGSLVLFLVLTIVSFRWIDHQKLSVIPILSVIFMGCSLSGSLVNLMRYLDSLKLRRKDEWEEHAELIEKLVEVKSKGQRAGCKGQSNMWISRLSVSIPKLERRMTSSAKRSPTGRASVRVVPVAQQGAAAAAENPATAAPQADVEAQAVSSAAAVASPAASPTRQPAAAKRQAKKGRKQAENNVEKESAGSGASGDSG